MKTKLLALSSIFLLSSLTAAGCTATPEAYHKASTRVGCRALKKCEEDLWKEAGYDNVSDCVDESLKVVSESDFADLCADYDKKEARKCLRSGRKYKRSCDDGDIDEDACAKVCGTPTLPGTGELTPEERGRAAAEAQFAAGEITEQELDEELSDIEFEAELASDEDEALLQAEIDAVFAEED
ncbi:MAG: hypothetical protein ACRBN8_09900 [Nannocystales bacterium]